MKPGLWGGDLYGIQSAVTGAVKIGRSSDLPSRLSSLQVGSPHRLRLILLVPNQGHREKEVHRALGSHRTQGEWFLEHGLGDIPVDIWDHREAWYIEAPDWWR